MNCHNCNEEMKSNWEVCPLCGKRVKCPHCGIELESGWNTCPECRKVLDVQPIDDESPCACGGTFGTMTLSAIGPGTITGLFCSLCWDRLDDFIGQCNCGGKLYRNYHNKVFCGSCRQRFWHCSCETLFVTLSEKSDTTKCDKCGEVVSDIRELAKEQVVEEDEAEERRKEQRAQMREWIKQSEEQKGSTVDSGRSLLDNVHDGFVPHIGDRNKNVHEAPDPSVMRQENRTGNHCPQCKSKHSSIAKFCPRCGTKLCD